MAGRAKTNIGFAVAIVVMLIATGCASTNVTAVASNQVIISASAELVCGQQSAQKVAARQAAVETIRRGFDRYLIIGSQGSSDVYQVGTTPVYANTSASGAVVGNSLYVNGTTNIYGGYPIYDGNHNRDLTVVMFKNGDPEGVNALDARTELGPNWQKIVSKQQLTCL